MKVFVNSYLIRASNFVLTFNNFRRLDWILFVSVLVLMAMGSMAITSVSLSRDVPDWQHSAKHGIFVLLALGIIQNIPCPCFSRRNLPFGH